MGWSHDVQQRMGFNISSPNIGFVDFRTPTQFFAGINDDDEILDTDPEPQVEIVNAKEVNKIYKQAEMEKPFPAVAIPAQVSASA